MAITKVCMQCRRVREGVRCSACGDGLLDLSNETDRMIVRTAINRPSVADIVAVLVTLGVGMIVLIGFGARGRWLAGLLQLLAIAAGVLAIAAVRARRRRAWGITASDLTSAKERAAHQRTLVEWLTGVPLWTAVAIVAVHAARASSVTIEQTLAPLALRLGDLGEGTIGASLIGHAALHAGAAHLLLNAAALLVFGHPLALRVRRTGTLLLLIGGIVGGAVAQSLLGSSPETMMVGISGGVYAWLAAPAVLDPNLRTAFALRGFSIPMPMWLRVVLSILLFAGIDAVVSAGAIAVFAHLGGALAGLALAIPLRRMTPSPSYARWRATHQRNADSA